MLPGPGVHQRPDIASTIASRQATHGDFAELARTAQTLKGIVRASPGFRRMTPVQREAIESIILKVARLCVGDPGHADHWHDVAGYALLVEQALFIP